MSNLLETEKTPTLNCRAWYFQKGAQFQPEEDRERVPRRNRTH